MYDRAAAYDVLHAARQKDDAGEAARVAAMVKERRPEARSLLDTACGTGGHLRFLRDHFDEVEGLDGSPAVRPGLGSGCPAWRCTRATSGPSTSAASSTPSRACAARSPTWNPPPLPRIDSGEGEGLSVTRMTRSWREGERTFLDMQYLIGSDEVIEHVHEHHANALYDEADYREAFAAAGCTVEVDAEGLIGRGLYIGVRRTAS